MKRGQHPNSRAALKPTEFQPGQSGNPAGRGMAGATLREWLNVFADQNLTAQQLRKIESDNKSPWPKRAAATRALRTVESGDLCDFDDYLDGKKTLRQLRKAGIDTSVIKRAKSRTRTCAADGGGTVTTVEREIELHDRSGEEFDRVSNRTEGLPKARVDVRDTAVHHVKRIIIEDERGQTIDGLHTHRTDA